MRYIPILNRTVLFHRPLPDERPRQSVANLIGRFEQQNKRNSLTHVSPVPGLPRSSSSASNIDPTKEEVKERHEWPPKAASPPTLSTAPSTSSLSPSIKATSAGTVSPSRETEAVALPSLQSPMGSPPSSFKSTDSTRDGSGRDNDSPKQSIKTIPSPKPTTTKQPTKPNSATPKKSPVGMPAKSTSSTLPIKPQHTGQSQSTSLSTGSIRKTQTSKAVTPNTPKTPSRSKTPTTTIRSKTPSSSRPKTPSSGLFAPTAASLARSRNGPPPTSPQAKKPALTDAVAERLSKPTAASLSRVRTPTTSAVHTPPRASAKTPTPRGSLTPKTTARPKTASALTKAKREPEHSTIPKVFTSTSLTEIAGEIPSEDESSYKDTAGSTTMEETPTAVVSDQQTVHATEDSQAAPSVQEESHIEETPSVTDDRDDTTEAIDRSSAAVVEEEVASHRIDERRSDDSPADPCSGLSLDKLDDQDTHDHAPEPLPELDLEPGSIDPSGDGPIVDEQARDELEDMVNLLESRPRLVNTMVEDEDVVDIPDEEQ